MSLNNIFPSHTQNNYHAGFKSHKLVLELHDNENIEKEPMSGLIRCWFQEYVHFLNTHQRVHLRATHFVIRNYTSIKIWKLHTLIRPQLLWIFSWFIKWGVHSNMHFDYIMNMKQADYQFIFLWKPRDRTKTTLCDGKMDLPILQHFQFSIYCHSNCL